MVLIVLAAVGVSERRADADEANRVEQLAEFAQANAELTQQLELESLASAVYMSYGDATGPAADAQAAAKVAMDEQRAATDAAVESYQSVRESTNPGEGEPEILNALDGATGRLEGLDTVRASVDDLQTDPPRAADQYNSTVSALVDVNVEVAKAADQPELARGLASFVNLGRVKAATAQEASLLAIVVQQGRYNRLAGAHRRRALRLRHHRRGPGDLAGRGRVLPPSTLDVIAAQAQIAQSSGVFEENATIEQKQIVRDAEAGQDFSVYETRIIEAGQDIETRSPRRRRSTCRRARSNIEALKGAEDELITTVLDDAASLASDAQRTATLFAVGTIGAIVVALIIAFFVYRAVTVPMRQLTSAAYTLSTERLPALVERLRNPEDDTGESLAETLKPIEIDSRDEIGQLAEAFNSIQQVTVEVAEEQAQLLRKGIGDIFINLARRNQTLLDRQIEFIDQLEANEEDPDQLDNLFKLDHLATRMRRNAESLLVLAGAEPPRRRGRPVALADVVRVAIGEVEDFARIQLLSLDDATVGGNVAVDLAHLLSELMENATHFSPPDTMVEIVGHRAEQGYTLSVSDQGIGMSADQLAEANTQLARPPLVGLALSRSLGFIVIGRLAARFDIQVKLTSSPSGGVTALVTLPRDIVTFEGEEAPPAAEAPAAPAPAEPVEEEIVLEDAGVDLIDELVVEEEPATAEADEEFERGLQSLVDDELAGRARRAGGGRPGGRGAPGPGGRGGSRRPPWPRSPRPRWSRRSRRPPWPRSPRPRWSRRSRRPPWPEEPPAPAPAPVAEAPAAPAEDEAPALTAAGLVKRTPKKRSEAAVGGGSITAANQQQVPSGQSSRSPEEIRKMLSRYRSGLNKGAGRCRF